MLGERSRLAIVSSLGWVGNPTFRPGGEICPGPGNQSGHLDL